MDIDTSLEKILKEFCRSTKKISVLTGAGISAESNIPTFRGKEGYWTVGSKEYHPQEMATWQMFTQKPWEVWKWYLYRLEVCRQAEPNPGHYAVVEMEKMFGDRFTLMTQNVDNLHLRAGSSPETTYQIHGNVFMMRCADGCSNDIYPVPKALYGWKKGRDITEDEQKLLCCPKCGRMTRPHVLWFDEVYDEIFYRLTTTLEAARDTDLLLVAGTSGMTNLPNKIAWEVSRRLGTVIIDINPEKNPFAALALKSGGYALEHPSGTALPALAELFKSAL